jgi:large subunit ribosomal protein L18
MERLRVKQVRRTRRKLRVRKRIFGTPARPRLTIYRSLKHMYAQIIDDTTGATLAWASSRDRDLRDNIGYGGNRPAAAKVGAMLAKRALAHGIERVAFDRNGYRYHGRVKVLADAAREAGLKL